MDATISQAVSPAMTNRVSRPDSTQTFQLDPPDNTRGVEADVARIFAKRAFQAVSVEKPPPTSAPAGSPRGQRLDIRA